MTNTNLDSLLGGGSLEAEFEVGILEKVIY